MLLPDHTTVGTRPAAPLFVLGAPRSGTSMLYKCICLRPDVAWVSNWVRRFPTFSALAALDRVPAHFHQLRRAAWFGTDSNAYVYRTARSPLRRAFPMPVEGEPFFDRTGLAARPGERDAPRTIDDLRRAVASLVKWSGGTYFVSKRISHNWRIPTLAAAFPDAHFVHLVRDGRAVAASLSEVDWWPQERLWWAGDATPDDWRASGGSPWEAAARTWTSELDQIAQGSAHLPPGRLLTVRYEDFITEPTRHLEDIARFAGMPVEPAGWQAAIAEMQFPNRNERWPDILGNSAGEVESLQRLQLEQYGYAAISL
jgi:hypothetical protein